MNDKQIQKNIMKHQKGKTCTKCNEHKPLSEFNKYKRLKDGLFTYCKACHKKYQDNICRFKRWFGGKKGRAKYKGIEFTIEPTDIPGVKIKPVHYNDTVHHRKTGIKSWEVTEYPKVCPVQRIELDWNINGRGGHDNSPSLDRIDPTKGYIPGNVMIMSSLANKMKSNSTLEQKKIEARYYLFNNK
tara:strand:- start:83 stop:640 length:558 start_codon:yes stop_codon:yes gene_type:complete